MSALAPARARYVPLVDMPPRASSLGDLRADAFRCVAAKIDGIWEYSLSANDGIALHRARNAGRVVTVLRSDARGVFLFAKLAASS
jgi:hypothetical protein